MKVFLATASMIMMSMISSNAFAAIGVGSSLDYNSVYTNGSTTVNEKVNYTIVSEDTSKGTYKVQVTIDDGKSKKVSEEETEVKTATIGAELVKACVENGGVLEKVAVPAGEFETCHFTDVDVAQDYVGDFWIGDVAFGTIKSVETLGKETLSIELQSVK